MTDTLNPSLDFNTPLDAPLGNSLPKAPALHPTAERPVFLILDYDGTLTPIVARPEDAVLTDIYAARLNGLNTFPNLDWALLSGRSVAQLQGFMAPFNVQVPWMGGLHGGELWQNTPTGGQFLAQPQPIYKPQSDQFQQLVESALAELYPPQQWDALGIAIEDKAHCFALHYRRADDAVAAQCETLFVRLYEADADTKAMFRLQPGKKVIEIVPHAFNKGLGVKLLLQHAPANALPVFVGDDLTDEAGFEAINAVGGLSVKVGQAAYPAAAHPLVATPSHTAATTVLPTINAVYDWLADIQ